MPGWFDRHSAALQGLAAGTTALAALAALVIVPWQIAASDRSQRENSAREIYREFLNISIQRPDLASRDLCAPATPAETAAYEGYVEYLLYTAEQVLTLGVQDWGPTITARLSPHARYLCGFEAADFEALTDPVAALVHDLRQGCAALLACGS